MDKLKDIKCFLIDLDGTIYIDGRLIDGALETLQKIKDNGKIYKFLTNNSSRSVKSYQEKLLNLGIKTAAEDIITSNLVAIEYLKENFKDKKIYLMAPDDVLKEYESAGIYLTDSKADVVVLAYDTSLTYEKLSKACNFIRNGAFYIATHPDVNCPAEGGYLPDLGSVMECVYASVQKRADIICGKPHKIMGDYIKKICGLSSYQIAMVGDRLYTDMEFAVNSSFLSILVLSGETKRGMINKNYDFVLNSIKDLFYK